METTINQAPATESQTIRLEIEIPMAILKPFVECQEQRVANRLPWQSLKSWCEMAVCEQGLEKLLEDRQIYWLAPTPEANASENK